MNSEQELSKKIKTYQALEKDNPNVDLNLLMMDALSGQKQNTLSTKAKRWAYLISISIPPFGFLFAMKFFLRDEEDAKNAAWTCIIFTIVSVLTVWILGKIFFSGSPANI